METTIFSVLVAHVSPPPSCTVTVKSSIPGPGLLGTVTASWAGVPSSMINAVLVTEKPPPVAVRVYVPLTLRVRVLNKDWPLVVVTVVVPPSVYPEHPLVHAAVTEIEVEDKVMAVFPASAQRTVKSLFTVTSRGRATLVVGEGMVFTTTN